MESAPAIGTAEAVGKFFANLPASRKASAHVGVDTDSAVRYVEDKDVAYAAPGLNARGLHLEIAGYARYSLDEWQGTGRMIELAAEVVRDWCDKYGIPKQFVDAAALERGDRGITTHKQVSDAFNKSDHWDPGVGFDMIAFVQLVSGVTSNPTEVIESKDEDMPRYANEFRWPNGDSVQVYLDGRVECFGAKSWGSMHSLRDDAKQDFKEAHAIAPVNAEDSQAGYIVYSQDGTPYKFDESARKFFK